jgi:hypothetical protein
LHGWLAKLAGWLAGLPICMVSWLIMHVMHHSSINEIMRGGPPEDAGEVHEVHPAVRHRGQKRREVQPGRQQRSGVVERPVPTCTKDAHAWKPVSDNN